MCIVLDYNTFIKGFQPQVLIDIDIKSIQAAHTHLQQVHEELHTSHQELQQTHLLLQQSYQHLQHTYNEQQQYIQSAELLFAQQESNQHQLLLSTASAYSQVKHTQLLLIFIIYLLSIISLFTMLQSNINIFLNKTISIAFPLRTLILHNITNNIPHTIIKDLFNISMRTINHAHKTTISLKQFIFKRNNTKISTRFKARRTLAKTILDEIIPVISGHTWRIQKYTNKHLYTLYKLQVLIRGSQVNKTNKPLSLSSVHKHILKKWSIHHSIDATICPHCNLLENYGENQPTPAHLLEEGKEKDLATWKKKLAKAKGHPERIKAQHTSFRETKDKLAAGLLPDTLILLQDFTQLQPQSGFNQDLILTFMSHDIGATDKIKREFDHWIADKEKNDLYFVVSVWEHLLSTGRLKNFKHIEIWSDGGGKHFKCSATMHYFSTIK